VSVFKLVRFGRAPGGSGSLMTSRAQVMSPSGVRIWFLRAQMTRCAQLASIASASHSYPWPKAEKARAVRAANVASSSTPVRVRRAWPSLPASGIVLSYDLC